VEDEGKTEPAPPSGTHPAEPPTIAASPAARRDDTRPAAAPREPGTTRGLTTASATTTVALRTEEAERTRAFGRTVALICGAMLSFVPFLGGDAGVRAIAATSLTTLCATAVWVWRRGALDENYSPRVFRLFGWACVTSALTAVYYLGVFSPAPVCLTLGISFFGLGGDRRFAFAICGTAAVGYVMLSSTVALGFLPDHGLLGAMSHTAAGKVASLVMVPVVFVVALWQARVSRAATIAAMERAQSALQVAGQREAQLNEANQDLDRALRAGAGQAGRHTGARAGSYQLAEIVGRGATGEVYAALHDETRHAAAVKVLNAYAAADPDLRRRFHREGKIAAGLDSPHVVRVHEIGELADGAPYLAMELLEGKDLATLLRQYRQLDLEAVVELATHVATGLDAAHAAGVVHRDVKPQNLIFADTPEGSRWKVIDFGISKARDSSGTLTQTSVVGTPGYMSPEQAQGKPVDARSDIFSLGAVLYRALTGRPPFAGPDMPQVLFEIVYRAPMKPSELAHGVPDDVDRVIAIALAKKADDRFQTAGELAAAMAAAAKGALAPALRQRADRLIAAIPWGRRAQPVAVAS
jgi:serine/threonine-protein kinase